MASNDRIILDEILDVRRLEEEPESTPSRFFEFFTAEQILKNYGLSDDEVESGLIGDGGDGGIDSFYLLVNDELVQEDADYSNFKKGATLDLLFLQSKMSPGFAETPIERFITVSDDVLDLSRSPDTLRDIYHERLVEAITRFRNVHRQLASKFPTLRLEYNYACKGTTPGDSIRHKVEKLGNVVKAHFPEAQFTFRFLGAPELLALARRAPQTTYSLTLAENPISSEGQIGFACLVRLRDFYNFITDERGDLRRQLFEANVRDYQGRTEVNDEIQKSLRAAGSEDFWWLNNGVSILAGHASLGGKTLTIEDPVIVNGLQTSTEIYNYVSVVRPDTDARKVLVRVIVPDQEESRDRIIKATNSQTPIQQASLRATDKIHRDIEEFCRPRGLYYDRRKNVYKNEGKPRDKIVGIPFVAQSIMAVVMQRPDTARARPSSLLKKDEDYQRVYNPSFPINLYFVCADGMRRVELFMKSPRANLTPKDRSNLRFYVGMHAIVGLSKTKNPGAVDLASVDLNRLDDDHIARSLEVVRKAYTQLGGTDQVAKGPALLAAVRSCMV